MIELIEVKMLGLLFGLFMIYITFLHLRRKEFSTQESAFWFIIWGIFIFVVLIPTSLDFLIKDVLNLGRRLDFFIIVGFMFIIGVVFHNCSITKKTQNKVEKLVRNIAIRKKGDKYD